MTKAPSHAEWFRGLIREQTQLQGRLQAIADILASAANLGLITPGDGKYGRDAAISVVSCEGFKAADGNHPCAKKVSWSVGVRSPSRKRCPECAGEQHKFTVKQSRNKVGRKDVKKNGALILRSGGMKPSRTDREFALFVQQHPGSSAEQIREGLNTSQSIVKRKLHLLKKHGLVHVVGWAGSARWFHGPLRKPEAEPDQVSVWDGRGGMPGGSSVSSSLSGGTFSKSGI